MSFVNKIRTSQAKDIYLVNGQVGKKESWYFVHLTKLAYERFKIESKESAIQVNIEKYGKVIKSGWGQNPPKYIQDKVDREGLNYDDSELQSPPDQVGMNYFVRAEDSSGKWAYYYMEISAAKVAEFVICTQYGNCNIGDYGKIVKSGYGEPSDELKAQMRAIGYFHPEDNRLPEPANA